MTEASRQRRIEELIERSSLGTPAAKALRARTPPEVAQEILRRSDAMTDKTPDYDMAEHDHGNYFHTHAWSSEPHGHFARAVCSRPECRDQQTHNIHPAPSE